MSGRELLFGKLTYSATGLPPGLTIDQDTGAITGTPTTPGKYLITVRATSGEAPGSRRDRWALYWFLRHWHPKRRP